MYERHALFTLYTIDTRRYKLKTVTKNLIHLFLPWQENKKSDDICVEPKWLTCKSWTSRYPLYSTAVLNLNHSLSFSSSLSFITFSSREKVIQKAPGTGKISHDSLLLRSRMRHPSVGCGAEAHSFGELKLPSSQTLLARNGTIEGCSLLFRRSGTCAA